LGSRACRFFDCQGHRRQADAPALALGVDRHHRDLTRLRTGLIVQSTRDEADRRAILYGNLDEIAVEDGGFFQDEDVDCHDAMVALLDWRPNRFCAWP
jgi:hypothetical protein